MKIYKGVEDMDDMTLIAEFLGSIEYLKRRNAEPEETRAYLEGQGLPMVEVEPERFYRSDANVRSFAAHGHLREPKRRAVVVYPDHAESYVGTKESSASITLERMFVQSGVAAMITMDHIESPGGNRLALYATFQTGNDVFPYNVMWKLPRSEGAYAHEDAANALLIDTAVAGNTIDGRL